MKLTRLKANYFYYALSLLIFTCYCTSCREERSDNKSQTESTKETTPIDTALVLAQADSLFFAGEQSIKRNQKDSALAFHQKALSLRITAAKENAGLAESYFKLAWLYLEDFKYDVADPYIEKARLIADQSNEINPQLYIEIYLQAASCKANLMDIASALSLIVKAESLIKKNFPDDPLLLARAYHTHSGCYFYNKEYDKGIDFIKKSIELIPFSNHKKLALAYSVMALYFRESKKTKEALQYYNKSIEENLKWTDWNSDAMAIVYLQKAFALSGVGQIDSARYFLSRNLEIRRTVFGDKHVNTFGALYSLAELEYTNGLFDSSAHHYQQSLISLIRNFNDLQLSSNPDPEPTELNSDLIIGLVGKAKAIRRMSLADSSSTLKELSLRTYVLADSVFSIFRSTSNYDDPKLKQLENEYIDYDEMTALAFELFNTSHNSEFAEIALGIMERSRALLIQNSLQKAEAFDLANINPSFKVRELEFTRQRAELIRNLTASDLPEIISDSLNNNLLLLDEAFSRLREEIRLSNPTYYASRYQSSQVQLPDIQFFLKNSNATLLEYLWSDSAIYLLKVTPTGIDTRVIHQSSEFRNAFRDFTKEMKIGEESITKMDRFVRFCTSAHLLYTELISYSLERIPSNSHLIISADGLLSIFPFEALIKSTPDYSEVGYHLPYLVLDHSISYAYSSALLLRQPEKSRHGKKLLALGFAGNGSSREKRSGMVNLPGTRRELEAIKEVMKNHTNQYFLENDASEYMFKKSIKSFNVAHLALHGVSDTLNALESRIVFRSETDTIEDGQLYAHELYDLDLSQLDLAVLSACESGIGKHQTGEGAMSMARGFAYAGCPSLVMSLWKLDDKTSAQVMSSFYSQLSTGETIDASLANAKREYLKKASEFNAHPSYWAAFILVGDSNGLDMKRPNWWGWAFLLLTFLTLLFLYLNALNRKALKHFFVRIIFPKKLR